MNVKEATQDAVSVCWVFAGCMWSVGPVLCTTYYTKQNKIIKKENFKILEEDVRL